MNTCAFVFARGGSKGVRKKNIRTLCGRPLLSYSLDLALQIDDVEKVFVSTDDDAIAEVARSYGVEVIDRPLSLAHDDSPEWLAWQHAVKWVQGKYGSFEVFLSLPTTSPLRIKDDVVRCLIKLGKGFDFVITMTEASRSPWFNMVKRDHSGRLSLLINDRKGITRRQDSPLAYSMCTVAYASRPECILNGNSIWDGKVGGVLIPSERALDIDTEYDLELAEFLINRRI